SSGDHYRHVGPSAVSVKSVKRTKTPVNRAISSLFRLPRLSTVAADSAQLSLWYENPPRQQYSLPVHGNVWIAIGDYLFHM
ncbi:MAG: hypothetical protein ACUVQH_14565, partial [Thermogutta sp.]